MANLIEIIISAVDANASATMARVASNAHTMGGSLLGTATALAATGAALEGVALGVGKVVQQGAHFESFTQNIHNETTMTTEELGRLREGLLSLGNDTGVAFEELGAGFLNVQNIAQDTGAAFVILEAATRSAVSTGADASDAARILANVMHEYGLDVVKAADGTLDLEAVQANAARTMGVMHLAAAMGNVTLEEFSKYSSRAIGVAANFGVPLEEVAAAFASLTRHGFDAAASGVQMTNILTKIANPTIQASKEIKRLSELTGVDLVSDFTAAGLHAKGLDGVLNDLQLAFSRMGMTTKEQSLLLAMLDGSLDEATEGFIKQGFSQAVAADKAMDLIHAQRGGLGLATLLNTGWKDYNETLDVLGDRNRTATFTQEAFNRTAQTAVFQWDRLGRIIQATAIVVGMAMLPQVGQLLAILIPLAEATFAFAQSHADLIGKVLLVAGAVSGLVGAALLLGAAIAFATVSLAALAPFLPAIAAGLATLAVQGTVAVVVWKNFRDEIGRVIAVVGTIATAMRTAFQSGDFNAAFGPIVTAIEAAFGSAAAAKVTLFVSDALRGAQLLRDAWLTFRQALDGDWYGGQTESINTFVRVVGRSTQLIRDAILTIGEAWAGNWISDGSIQPVVRAIGEFVTNVREAADAARDLAGGALAFLAERWGAISIIGGIVVGVLMGLPAALIAVGTAAKALGMAWAENWNGIREKATAALTAIGAWIDGTALPALHSFAATITGTVVPAIADFAAASMSAAESGVSSIKSSVSDEALPALQSLGSWLMETGRSAWNGFTQAIEPLVAAIRSGLAGALQLVTPALNALKAAIFENEPAARNLALAGENLAASWRNLQPLFKLIGDAIGPSLVIAVGLAVGAIGALVGWLTGVLPGAIQVATGAILVVTGTIRQLTAVIGGMAAVFQAVLEGDSKAAWEAAKNAAVDAATATGTQVEGIDQMLQGTLAVSLNSTAGAFAGFAGAAGTYFGAVSRSGQQMSADTEASLRQMAGLTNYLGPFTEGMLRAAAAEKAVAEQAAIMAGAVPGSESALRSLEQITGKTALGLRDIDSYGDGAANRINDLANAALAAGGTWNGWSLETDRLKNQLNQLTNAIDTTRKALDDLGSQNSKLAGDFNILKDRYDVLAEKQRTAAGLTADEAVELATLGAGMDKLGAIMGGNEAQRRQYVLDLLGLGSAADDTKNKLNVAEAAVAKLNGATEASSGLVGLTDGLGNVATAADIATTSVSGVGTAVADTPTTLNVAVATPGGAEAKGAIAAVAVAIWLTPKSFTVTAYVDTGPALAAIADLNAHLPHSPAEKGPLSVLPNWAALFESLPSEAAKSGAEAVSAIAAAVTSILAAFTVLTNFDTASGTPSEAQLGWLGATMATIVGTIRDATAQFSEEALEAVSGFAEAASAVGGMIATVLEGLAALATADFARISLDENALGWFAHLVTSLVLTVAEAAGYWDEETVKAVQGFADTASAVGTMITDALEGLKALADADFAAISPDASALGWFAHMVASLVGVIASASAAFSTEAIEHAGEFASVAGEIASLITAAVEGLAALATADWANTSPDGSALGWFAHLLASLVRTFADSAALFEIEALDAAAAYAESAGAVVGILKDATEGLAAMAGFVPPIESDVALFLASLSDLMERFGTWASGFEADVLAHTTVFAEAAGAATGILGEGVDGLTALIGFIAPAEGHVSTFLLALSDLMERFGTWASGFEADALESSTIFAEAAGAVVAVIAPAVEGFAALATLVLPTERAMDQLVGAIRYIVRRFADIATMLEAEGIAHLQAFAAAAGDALSAAKTGTDLFKSFDELVIPSAQAIDNLLEGIKYIVRRFYEMAQSLDLDGVPQLQEFAAACGDALSAAKTGTDLFNEMKDLAIPSAAAIDNLLLGIAYVINRTREIATSIGTDGLAQAQAFATGALNVVATMAGSLDLFGQLAEHKGKPEEALRAVWTALEGAITAATDANGRAATLKELGRTFAADMAEAARLFAEGLGGDGPLVYVPDIGLGKDFLPGREKGGPVEGDEAYVVGEDGPEVFLPGRSGTIVPNSALRAQNGRGGGDTIVIQVAGSLVTERQLIDKVRNELLKLKRSVPSLGLS